MGPLYRCDTREAAFAALPAPLRDALAAWSARNQVTLDGAQVWVSRCENLPGEGFVARLLGRRRNPVDPDAEHTMALALHATQLVVGAWGERAGATALGVPLATTSITRGSELAARLGPHAPTDDGITIHGVPVADGRTGTYFFKLGGPGADACFTAVESAVRARKLG